MVFSISHFTAETKYFQVKHLILSCIREVNFERHVLKVTCNFDHNYYFSCIHTL